MLLLFLSLGTSWLLLLLMLLLLLARALVGLRTRSAVSTLLAIVTRSLWRSRRLLAEAILATTRVTLTPTTVTKSAEIRSNDRCRHADDRGTCTCI